MREPDVLVVFCRGGSRQKYYHRLRPTRLLRPTNEFLADARPLMRHPHREIGEIGDELKSDSAREIPTSSSPSHAVTTMFACFSIPAMRSRSPTGRRSPSVDASYNSIIAESSRSFPLR